MSDLLSKVPLKGLSYGTKVLLSTHLNPNRILPSSKGLPRDWRGLADVCSITGAEFISISQKEDQTCCIIDTIQQRSKSLTLQSLRNFLEQIERWDIIDDADPLLEKDARLYLEKADGSRQQIREGAAEIEESITFENHHFDAFLLYADEDQDFVDQILTKLEKENNMKICIKDRDLIPGITFEHKAIMKIISERCNKLLAIISPHFLKSPANNFFLSFAQAVGIHQQRAKIIPCIHNTDQLTTKLVSDRSDIAFVSKLYTENKYFWNNLVKALEIIKKDSLEEVSSTSEAHENVKPMQQKKVTAAPSIPIRDSYENNSSPCKKKKYIFGIKKGTKPKSSSESIPELPSLDGLDSLPSLTDGETSERSKSKKKKKSMRGYLKKAQSLLS